MIELAELLLTDGATTIDLLSLSTAAGLHLRAWTPSSSRYKGRGVWHDSPFASGKRPAFHAWDATEESMRFALVGLTADDLAHRAADFRNLLQRAWDFFEDGWPQADPVYLVRRAQCETNRAYSLVLGGETPQDGEYTAEASAVSYTVGYESWEVRIWREEHWRDCVPGSDGVCLPSAGYEPVSRPCFVEFAADGAITVPAGVGLDDLMDAAFTAELWVKFDTMANCQLFDKGLAGPAGWDLAVSAAGAVTATIQFSVADAVQNSANGVVVAGTWHHVAMTWDPADNRPLIWIGGAQPAYAAGQDKNGATVADGAHALLVGNNVGATADLQGDVGWARVSDAERYAAPFTPTPRCDLPAIDASTVGQWVGAECAGATIRNQEGTAAFNGTLANGTFDCDCQDWVGNVDPADDSVDYSCDEDDIEAFVRNGQARAAVTQIWIGAGGGGPPYTGNWAEEDAYALLPAVVQAGDEVYFGVDSTAAFCGPFFNLVFDLADNGVDLHGHWEYWSTAAGPGWQNLAAFDHDGTDELQAVGACANTWELPSNDWEVADPGGIGFAAYWVRFAVQNITANNPPVQQNRPVYTTNWAFTEMEGASVSGDVPALAKVVLPLAGEPETVGNPDFNPARVILALRSLSRGADFVPYLNFGDDSVPGALGAQAPVGVTANTIGIGAQVTDDTRQQGVHVLATNTAPDTWEYVQQWEFAREYAPQYYGRHRLFLRAKANALAGAVQVRAQVLMATETITSTPAYTFPDTNRDKLIDLGIIDLPPFAPAHETDLLYAGMYVYVQQTAENVADTVRYYDMILLPADEKVVEAITVPAGVSMMSEAIKTRLLLDSATLLRSGSFRALVASWSDDDIAGVWQPISAGPLWFQASADQRLWFLAEEYSGTYWYSVPHTHMNVLLKRVARYRSLRGSR